MSTGSENPNEPFRDRRYVPLPPEDRPHKVRTAVRIVVLAGERVLLFADSDPGLPEQGWWVTPGGGIDPGETPARAAVRELQEETGLVITEDELIGPVARRVAVHGYSDQVLEQAEDFYVVRTHEFEVDEAGHTEDEKLTLQGSRWWPLNELVDTDEWIWPSYLLELIELADDPEAWVVDKGREVDESTLGV
ncbi:NUDIX hydrolase [Mariniluteicoccus flavus]